MMTKASTPLGLGHVHAAELGRPLINAGVTETVLAAKLGDRRACIVLLQNAGDLFVGAMLGLHSAMGQSLLQNRLFQRGEVTSVLCCSLKTDLTPRSVSVRSKQIRLATAPELPPANQAFALVRWNGAIFVLQTHWIGEISLTVGK